MKIYICSDIQIRNLKVNFTLYILILFFFVDFSLIHGQKLQLKVSARLEENNKVLERTSFIEFHDSEESIENEISKIQSTLELKGYLNNTLDTLIISDSVYKAQFLLGERLERIRIYYNNSEGVSSIDLKTLLKPLSKNLTDTYIEISFEEITELLNYIVDYYEDKGNSFTQVTLKNIALDKEVAIAQLKIKTFQKRNIDKVIVKGYESFPKKYIRHDLNIKVNTIFNDAKLLNASNAVNSLSFVDEIKPPEVLFTNDSTYIYLYLKKKRSNKFDGVLGFSSKENGDGLDFNGYLDFTFSNLFNGGETIALLWKNNGNNSQRFFVAAEIPYIFNLPITPKAEFEIFRQDTIYNNVNANFYLSYFINNQNEITGVFNSEIKPEKNKTINRYLSARDPGGQPLLKHRHPPAV
jgi:translocation and assembly module TamA